METFASTLCTHSFARSIISVNLTQTFNWAFCCISNFWLMISLSLLAVSRQTTEKKEGKKKRQKKLHWIFDLCCLSNNSLHSNELQWKCLLVSDNDNRVNMLNAFSPFPLHIHYKLFSCCKCFSFSFLFLCLERGCDPWTDNDFPIDYFNGKSCVHLKNGISGFLNEKKQLFYFANQNEWNII